MDRSSRPRRSSAATRSSSCRVKKKPWPRRGSSCSCTRILCRAGKGFANFGPLPRAARETEASQPKVGGHRAILAVWRIEQPRLITSLARILRDVPLAEDLTQEALLAALEHWPVTGVPERPGAWLMASAKNRALDHLRRSRMRTRKHDVIASDMIGEQQAMPDFDS